jgi:hypothetical protein
VGQRKLLHRRGLQLQAAAGWAVRLGQHQCVMSNPDGVQTFQRDARKFRGAGKN